MKRVGGLPLCLIATFFVASCTAEIPAGLDGDRYFYFAGDDKNLTWIDSHEPVDTVFIDNYTENPGNNGYWLFTRSNPVTPQILQYNDSQSLKKSNFNKNKKIVILVHGWRGSCVSEMNTILTKAFIQHEDLNVIVFDWSAIAAQNYMTAKRGVPSVGQTLGQFILWLNKNGAPLQRMHLVGHSLGAHLVGFAGKYLDGDVRRITGLDPASPLWHLKDAERLNNTDAEYVEIIHTNTLLLGYKAPIGDVDFYPNGGVIQPGCESVSCSHSRAYEYMAASVLYNHLKAQSCKSMLSMRFNTCSGEFELMGNSELREKAPGIYRVDTEKTWPYGVSESTLTIG